MLQIAIYDDTREHCEETAALLEGALRGRRAELECFPSSGELLRYIRSGGYAPDVAFLGVELWDGDGIALGEELNRLVPSCRIVFIGNALRFATEVYRAEHVWFILRDELGERIAPALEKALSYGDVGRGRGLLLRSKGKAVFLPLESVLYLERNRRRTIVRTESGEYSAAEHPYRLLAGALGDSFIRTHMSFWVNREKIDALERDEFVLCDGSRIPISRSRRSAAVSTFLKGNETASAT